MWQFYIWLFALITLVSAIPAIPRRLKQGDKCRLKTGGIGLCKRLTDCPPAIHDLDVKQIWPLYCTVEDFDPVVCCNELKTTTSTTTTTTTTTSRPQTIQNSNQVFKPGRIVKKKCKDYSRWLDPPILLPGAKKMPGLCGITVEKFIVGGQKTGDVEFPHMAHLGYGDESNPSYECGASLISEEFLLTAAHCLQSKDGSPLIVARLGTGDRRSQRIERVKDKIFHPDYRPPNRYNDIALVRLEKPLKEFSDYMRPACIKVGKEINKREGIATGWGYTSYMGEVSNVLLKVSLPFMNQSQCSKTYKKSVSLDRGITDKSMVCAGGYDLKKDTCNGDSGGPLQIIQDDVECMYSIVGVTSFGTNCGIAPGVYTRVSNFVPWIVPIVWPDEVRRLNQN